MQQMVETGREKTIEIKLADRLIACLVGLRYLLR